MSTKPKQTDQPQSRERTVLTPDGLRAVAAAIAKELEGYELIAKKMQELGVQSIAMTGLESLEQAVIKRIQGNIEAARRALNKETSGSLKATASQIIANRTKPTEKIKRRKPSA